jgi:hypothetical protein
MPNRISLQGPLHDQQTQPFPKFAPGLGQQTYLLKSKRRMEPDRHRIHPTNAGHHRVTAFLLAFPDQLAQKHLADTVPNAIRAHVNGVFNCKTITFAGPKLRCIAEADNKSLKLRYQIRQTAIQNCLSSLPHLRFIWSIDFKGCSARFYKLSIDRGDIRHVRGSSRPNHAFRIMGKGVVCKSRGATRRYSLALTQNSLAVDWIACSHSIEAESDPHFF